MNKMLFEHLFQGAMPARALQMPLSTVLNEVKPVLVEALSNGNFLYTFPKNFVGTIRVKALPKAAAKATLDLVLGEWLAETAPKPRPKPRPPGPAAQCAAAPEHAKINLGGCPTGQAISAVDFASFGTPTGTCKTGFKLGKCNAKNSVAYVSSQCVGRKTCQLTANTESFGGDPCGGTLKSLAVKISCAPSAEPLLFSASAPAATIGTVQVVGRVASEPLPPLPPRPDNSTLPVISGGKQQHETHVLRSGNRNDLETAFCWHGFQ